MEQPKHQHDVLTKQASLFNNNKRNKLKNSRKSLSAPVLGLSNDGIISANNDDYDGDNDDDYDDDDGNNEYNHIDKKKSPKTDSRSRSRSRSKSRTRSVGKPKFNLSFLSKLPIFPKKKRKNKKSPDDNKTNSDHQNDDENGNTTNNSSPSIDHDNFNNVTSSASSSSASPSNRKSLQRGSQSLKYPKSSAASTGSAKRRSSAMTISSTGNRSANSAPAAVHVTPIGVVSSAPASELAFLTGFSSSNTNKKQQQSVIPTDLTSSSGTKNERLSNPTLNPAHVVAPRPVPSRMQSSDMRHFLKSISENPSGNKVNNTNNNGDSTDEEDDFLSSEAVPLPDEGLLRHNTSFFLSKVSELRQNTRSGHLMSSSEGFGSQRGGMNSGEEDLGENMMNDGISEGEEFQSVLEESAQYLSVAMFVYLFADFRKSSLLGKSPIPFSLLKLESDDENNPHEAAAAAAALNSSFTHSARPAYAKSSSSVSQRSKRSSTGVECGRSISDILYLALRYLVANGALPSTHQSRSNKIRNTRVGQSSNALRAGFSNSSLTQAPSSRTIRSSEDKRAAAAVADDLIHLEGLFKSNLKNCPPPTTNTKEKTSSASTSNNHDHCKDDVCSKHVGTLCKDKGLHYIQCFFDQLYERAKDRDMYAKFMNTLLRENRRSDTDANQSPALFGSITSSTEEAAFFEKPMAHVVQGLFVNSFEIIPQLIADPSHRSRLVWINDRMSENDIIYMIVLNKGARTVTVVFRGSVTISDWTKNLDYGSCELPNPIIEDYPGKIDTIDMHKGYAESLFQPREDTGLSKYDEITEKVEEIGREYFGDEGYTLCVTGHSLGGGLSTLFGFVASTDPRFITEYEDDSESESSGKNNRNSGSGSGKRTMTGTTTSSMFGDEIPPYNPIRVYTFGCSISGRITFAHAFAHQERVGKIVHCRIVNENDLVPIFQPWNKVFSPVFRPTGIRVELKDDKTKPADISYVVNMDAWKSWELFWQGFILKKIPFLDLGKIAREHGLDKYSRNLSQLREHSLIRGAKNKTWMNAPLEALYADIRMDAGTHDIWTPAVVSRREEGRLGFSKGGRGRKARGVNKSSGTCMMYIIWVVSMLFAFYIGFRAQMVVSVGLMTTVE